MSDEDKDTVGELSRPLTQRDPEAGDDRELQNALAESDTDEPDEKKRVLFWLNVWLRIGAVSGYKTFSVYALFGLVNAVMVIFYVKDTDPYCPFLNITVVIFQWQSLALLCAAFAALRFPHFKLDLQRALLKMKESEALEQLTLNMALCLSIKAVGYITGIVMGMLPSDRPPQTSEVYVWYVNISDWLDFLRYLPVAIHVGAVRSMFQTFEPSLNALKQKLKIGTSDRDEFTLITLTCKYDAFVAAHQKLLYVYYRSSTALYPWIVCFTVFNIAIFIAYGLVLIQGGLTTGNFCQSTPLDFLHFGFEFISFLMLWFLFLGPLARNHRIHERFVRDVQAMTHKDPAQMTLIQNYLRSCWSPGRIMGTDLSYLKLFACFYVTCGMMGYGLVEVLKSPA